MSDTFESVVKHFKKAEVFFHSDPETKMAWAVLPTPEGSWNTCVGVWGGTLQVVAHYPLRIPNDKRSALAEFIVRASPRNNVARLEMDYDDGRLMARSRLYFDEELGLDDEAVFGPILAAVVAVDCVHPAVTAILHQGITAQTAVEMLGEDESKPDSSHVNRLNLQTPEGDLPWDQLTGDKLRNN